MKLTKVSEMDQVLFEAARLATTRARSTEDDRLWFGSPEDNEAALFEIIREVCASNFDVDSVRHIGGHKFPDIIFPFANAGVEIKCHRRASDTLMGNSIMGSTFALDQPKAIRLLVWADSAQEITCHDYFESVVGAEVTHSPRFRLRPGATKEEQLFGEGSGKVGTVDEVCLGPEGIDSERILARMRALALRAGNIPWWLGEAKPMAASSNLSIVRSSQLSTETRLGIESLATFLFPEVIGKRSPSKYNSVIAWGIATRGVLLSRDDFSANGKVPLRISEICDHVDVRVPRSFERGMLRLSRGAELSLTEARFYWNEPSIGAGDLLDAFSERLSKVEFDDVVVPFRTESCSACEKSTTKIEEILRERLVAALNVSIVD